MTASALANAPAVPGHYWSWRGQSIYYLVAGPEADDLPDDRATSPAENRPPLLLVHGFGASTDHWYKNVADLRRDFQVWAIDLLGFGRSAKPDWTYSGDLWRDQLHDFIQQVIGRPAVLAGNSLGGYACLCVAAQRPESARGLVLLNSAGPFTESPAEAAAAPNPVQKTLRSLVQSVLLQPWASYLLFQNLRRRSRIRKTLEQVYCDRAAVTDRLVEAIYRPSCDPGAARVFAAVFKARQGEKVDVLLQQMACPLLMLWGEGDPWMRVRDRAARFREARPDLTEHFLPAGHCPHDELPEAVDDRLRAWVETAVLGGATPARA